MASIEFEIDAGGIGRAARRKAREEQMAKFRQATPEFDRLWEEREAAFKAATGKLTAMLQPHPAIDGKPL